MKRFWLVLLSLGLVMAFSAQAFAVDVKFSGSFYAAGMYLDKTNVLKSSNVYFDPTILAVRTVNPGTSTAFYFQRLRLQADFVVSPGLSVVTRADIMERVLGAARSAPGTAVDTSSAGTTAENQNIAFDFAYVQWLSPIGYVMAGYMDDGGWGAEFGDSSAPLNKVQFATKLGNVTMAVYAAKVAELSKTATYAAGLADNDTDKYVAFAEYESKNFSAGFLYAYYRAAQYKGIAAPLIAYGFTTGTIMAKAHVLNPYAKAKIGPVSLEAEIEYLFGKGEYEDGVVGQDINLSMLTGFVGATVDLGPVYLGAKFAYVSGDNPDTTDKWEGGQIGGGFDWNPCLIMFNFDRSYWAGSLPGYGGAFPLGAINAVDSGSGLFGAVGMSNAWFYQGVVGVKPTAALDIRASVAYANADQKPKDVMTGSQYKNDAYGWEVDVVGSYKITNNLSYMLGFGYWFVGDYFKGTSASSTGDLQNDYLIINKLTLTF